MEPILFDPSCPLYDSNDKLSEYEVRKIVGAYFKSSPPFETFLQSVNLVVYRHYPFIGKKWLIGCPEMTAQLKQMISYIEIQQPKRIGINTVGLWHNFEIIEDILFPKKHIMVGCGDLLGQSSYVINFKFI